MQTLTYHEVATICSNEHKSLITNCKGCNHIKDIWYSFLKETGFEDIEKNKRYLNPYHYLKDRKDFQTSTTFQATISHFTWADKEHAFKSTKDRLIFEYYAQGYTHRKIADMIGLEHSWITRKIHRIKAYLSQK